jgi:HemY protein
MIRLLMIILLLAAGISLGPFLYGKKGYVLIAMGNYTIETSVLALALCILLVIFVLWLGEWLLTITLRKASQTRQRWKQRRHIRAQNETLEGLEALLAGRWKESLQLLTKNAELSDRPQLNYLAAAEAAGKLRQTERQQEMLHQAERSADSDKQWIALQRIRLLLNQGKKEQALAESKALWQQGSRDPELLQHLRQLTLELKDWEILAELADSMAKIELIDAAEADSLRLEANLCNLEMAAKQSKTALSQYCRNLPRSDKKQPELLARYAQLLAWAGEADEAQSLLLKAARQQLHPALLKALLALPDPMTDDLLYTVKHWLKGNDDNPQLLSLLGELSIKAGRLVEAQTYLEKALQIRPDPQDFQTLSALLERKGQHQGALQAQRKAIALSGGA